MEQMNSSIAFSKAAGRLASKYRLEFAQKYSDELHILVRERENLPQLYRLGIQEF